MSEKKGGNITRGFKEMGCKERTGEEEGDKAGGIFRVCFVLGVIFSE